MEGVYNQHLPLALSTLLQQNSQIFGTKTTKCRRFLHHYYRGTNKMGFIYQLTLIAIINLFIFVVGANAPSAFLHPNKIYPWIDDNWHPGWRELSLIVVVSTCNSSKKQQNNLHISCVFEKITLPLHSHSVKEHPTRPRGSLGTPLKGSRWDSCTDPLLWFAKSFASYLSHWLTVNC